MGKATYHNRYESINRVTWAVGELGECTATEISKKINLSRQNILDVLKHAETWGYVTHKEEPYRQGKDGTWSVNRKVWSATEYGKKNAGWYKQAVDMARKNKGQLPLL